jgi:adenosylcobalamin-dependent ribonucleoside-triphosphate reductase
MSNNSVVCNDFSLLPEQFWQGYNGNGEAYGLINLKLAKTIGRTGDTNYPDLDVIGFNPCAEQSLGDKETCCLAELYLPNIGSEERLHKVIKNLYRIAKHSLALPCHQAETEAIVHKNMRMGIGVTGYLQASEEQRQWLPKAYEMLRAFDVEYSAKNGFPTSIKLTTVKPSGTLSLLAGVTPGAHPGYSQYHIRRIRIASNNPMVETCRKNGYPIEFQRNFDGTEDKGTVVVSFPCSFPEGTKLAKDMTAIDQLEVVKRLQTEWSDNAVSVTIYYKKEELEEIKKWLSVNYNNNLKTVSFLLHSDHGFVQAPLEEITKEQFDELSAKVIKIESLEQSGDFEMDAECASGVCPIR